MDLIESGSRRYGPRVLLLVGFVALFLFSASYFVEIRVIIEEPQYGDVTGAVQTFWRGILGATTIGSFLIGVYTLVDDEGESEGLPTKVEIRGTGHDIDVYPGGPVANREDEDEEEESETESDDQTPSVDSDDDTASNTAGEQSAN